jgi:hypothetical protein
MPAATKQRMTPRSFFFSLLVKRKLRMFQEKNRKINYLPWKYNKHIKQYNSLFFKSKVESPIAHEWYRENIKHAMTRYLNKLSHFSMSVNKSKQVKKNQKLSFKSYALVSFFHVDICL